MLEGSQPIRVLVVEDDPFDALLVGRALAQSRRCRFDVQTAGSLAQAKAFLGSASVDVVLLDLSLPDAFGFETLSAMQPVAEGIPVLVLTGHDDEAFEAKALTVGAQDYLPKTEVSPASVSRAIVHAIQRERANQALKQSQAQLADAQATAQLGSFEWDITADRVAWSAELFRIYGVDPATFNPSYSGFLSRIHPLDVERVDQTVREAVKGGDGFGFEYRVQIGEDSSILQARGRVIRNGDGAAIRVSGTCQDITERKRLEDKLQLAGRMTAVGTLGAGVAHEISNPLAVVISNLNYLTDEVKDLAGCNGSAPLAGNPAQARERLGGLIEVLGEAAQGAERVRNIVRDLKLFSRAEDDTALPIVLHYLIDASLNLVAHEIRGRARVVKDYGEVPTIEANEARLGKLFVNLLLNAAQAIAFGNEAGNEIRVRTRKVDNAAVIEIADTGRGMSAEHVKRIFDPFFTTRSVGSGTGLGLAVCHGIVTALGGRIEVESTLGAGTTFRVVLPAS